MKKLLITLTTAILLIPTTYAQSLLFLSSECPACQTLAQYLEDNNIMDLHELNLVDLNQQENGIDLYREHSEKASYTGDQVPLLVVDNSYYEGVNSIIEYFDGTMEKTTLEAETVLDHESAKELSELMEKDEKSLRPDEPDPTAKKDHTTTIIAVIVIAFGLSFFIQIFRRGLNKRKK